MLATGCAMVVPVGGAPGPWRINSELEGTLGAGGFEDGASVGIDGLVEFLHLGAGAGVDRVVSDKLQGQVWVVVLV